MKYFLNSLMILVALSISQCAMGQESKSIERYHMHRVGNSNFVVKVPANFAVSEKDPNEFVLREQGTVVKFAFLQDIPASRFCDSMTTRYFESQGLTGITETKSGAITIFKGKFMINQVPYLRSFIVIPTKGSTILQIANYPEKLGGELETQFLNMIKREDDE
jgi:hypothetical protein